MFVGVAQGFATQLDPGVREKLIGRAPHTDANDCPMDPARLEQSGQRHRTYETLWSEHAVPGGPNDGERQPPCFWDPIRVDRTGGVGR